MVESIPSRSQSPDAIPTRDLSRCLLCDSAALKAAPFSYHFAGADFPAVRCARCSLVFLSRQPAGEGFLRLYGATYFEGDYHCGHHELPYFAAEAGETASAHILLEWIEREVGRGRILELGCAGGYFLEAARRRGWSPVGIEISPDAARFAREELKLEVHNGSLESARLAAESLDAAYLGDVLEHVPEPLATLQEIHRLLRPGGVLLIAGPITLNSLDRRLGWLAYGALGRSKILRQPPYHLIEFVPATLRSMLSRAGFEVRWLRESKIPPAWRNPRLRPAIEHALKLIVDGPNWLLTRFTGRLGDRAVVMAIKPRSE